MARKRHNHYFNGLVPIRRRAYPLVSTLQALSDKPSQPRLGLSDNASEADIGRSGHSA